MEITGITEIYSKVLLIDFLRYFLTASIAYAVFWGLIHSKVSHRIIQRKAPKFQQMWTEFKYSMSTVFIFSIIGLFIFKSEQAGITQLYTEVEGNGGWLWFGASIGVMIVIHDAYFYWMHRFMHHPKVFKHVHLVHHKSTSPSPWAAYSFHPIEAVIEAGIFVIFIFTMPIHVLALTAFLFYMITRNVLGHLGIELFPKAFMKNKWINWHTTTTHHDMHHKNFNTNYGLYFTWWDRWFSTEDEKYEETFEEVTSRSVTDKPVLKPVPVSYSSRKK